MGCSLDGSQPPFPLGVPGVIHRNKEYSHHPHPPEGSGPQESDPIATKNDTMAEGHVFSHTVKEKEGIFLLFNFVLHDWKEKLRVTLTLPREGAISEATQMTATVSQYTVPSSTCS